MDGRCVRVLHRFRLLSASNKRETAAREREEQVSKKTKGRKKLEERERENEIKQRAEKGPNKLRYRHAERYGGDDDDWYSTRAYYAPTDDSHARIIYIDLPPESNPKN